MNTAWTAASEEMYKATQENASAGGQTEGASGHGPEAGNGQPQEGSGESKVEDVPFDLEKFLLVLRQHHQIVYLQFAFFVNSRMLFSHFLKYSLSYFGELFLFLDSLFLTFSNKKSQYLQ